MHLSDFSELSTFSNVLGRQTGSVVAFFVTNTARTVLVDRNDYDSDPEFYTDAINLVVAAGGVLNNG